MVWHGIAMADGNGQPHQASTAFAGTFEVPCIAANRYPVHQPAFLTTSAGSNMLLLTGCVPCPQALLNGSLPQRCTSRQHGALSAWLCMQATCPPIGISMARCLWVPGYIFLVALWVGAVW